MQCTLRVQPPGPGDGTAFLVEVDADVTFSPPHAAQDAKHARFAYHVVDARCVQEAEILRMDMILDNVGELADGLEATHLRFEEERLNPPGTFVGVLIAVIDRGARYPDGFCTTYIKLPRAPGGVREDWLDRFKRDARD